MIGAIYSLLALGIVLILKSSGVFNLAVGEFVAFGCYIGWAFAVQLGVPFPLMFAGLFVVAALLALGIERGFMRPLIGQPVLSAIMITIALMQILAGIIVLVWPGTNRVYPPLLPSGTFAFWGVTVSQENLLIFLVCMGAFALFVVFFQYTRIGLVMRAVSEDQQLAQSQGIKVTSIISIAWFIAIAVAFIGGLFLGFRHGVNGPGLAALGLKSFPAVIVGGMESIPGALIGGMLVGISETFGVGYVDKYVRGGMAEVMPFIVLLLVLMIRPYGLFGYKKIERV